MVGNEPDITTRRHKPVTESERWMKNTIAAALGFAAAFAFAVPCRAGDWQWGCMGPLGDQQIVFSRYSLVVVPAKPSPGKLEDLFRIADLSEKFPDADAAYNADGTNDGLQKTMTYTDQSNEKNQLTLTETSSRDLAHTHHLVCGRDEDNSTERKSYRVERPNQPPATVTLQCREYTLSTRGGRPCISR